MAALLLANSSAAEAKHLKRAPHAHVVYHTSHNDYSKIPVPAVGYQEVVPEANLKLVQLASNDTDIGRIQRAYRWRNIADAVSERYGIPSNILLGMICVESEGDPTQPNAGDDGGLGLIHMQPSTASKYGLHLITPSKKLRDKQQGREVRATIHREHLNLKELVDYDDRLHPVKNLDAAGRMIADLYQRRGSWRVALERFAGRSDYDSHVMRYVTLLGSTQFMTSVASDFHGRNNGFATAPTFDRYAGIFFELNRNYGFDTYKKLPPAKVNQR